jgi:glycine dehydrogenase subunit 1
MGLAEYAKERVDLPLVFPGQPTFKEFAIRVGRPVQDAIHEARAAGVHAGYPLGRDYPGMDDALLVAVTERRSLEDIGLLVEALAE